MKSHFWKFCLLINFLLLFADSAKATHIVGGEIFYSYLGSGNYRVTMYIYRDCANGVPPFDNPAYIGIYDQEYNLVNALQVFVQPDSILIPSTINNPCFIPPVNICYRRATYIFNVNLPPSPGVYYIAYQRCCRNNTINNIIGPDVTGATYVGEIRASSFFNNSSPRFKNLPPPFVCLNYPFVFDHSATDSNQDTIRYSLCTPLAGGDTLDPAPIPPFSAPPYNNVIFAPPYTVNNMLNGTPGIQPLSIDSITGILTATPNTIGQFVIGVCAKEYRNNVYLGETRRDYQLNVVPCPSLVVAAFLNPIVSCGSNTVSFHNGSIGAISYHWDFGVPNLTNDTSNAFNPVYTYPDTGTYNVTLIAYSLFNPGCADTIHGVVTVTKELEADFTSTVQACSTVAFFNDTILSSAPASFSYNWNFGNGTTSNVSHPQVTYASPGNYPVTLIVTSSLGCKDTVTKTINIQKLMTAAASTIQNVRCNGECNGSGLVAVTDNNGPISILWTNPPGQTTDTIVNLCQGIYSGTVTDSAGCTSNFSLSISEPPPLTLAATATPDYCSGQCIGSATAQAGGGTPPYNFVWSNGSNSGSLNQLCAGNYTVSVTDSKGCSASPVTVNVLFSDSTATLDVVPSVDTIYRGQSVNLSATQNSSYTYNWQPPTYLNSNSIANPVSTPPVDIEYILSITDAFGCKINDTAKIVVIQYRCEEPEIFIPNSFSPNGDRTNDEIYVYGGQIKELLFRIYDRWGEKVFETKQPGKGWDGFYKGKRVTPGVFVYYVEATCYDNQKFFKKGNISVIR